MSQVRCVGTENPASSEYAPAAARPNNHANGSRSMHLAGGSQRQANRARLKATSANNVTCKPDIATRCVVPVALNTRH